MKFSTKARYQISTSSLVTVFRAPMAALTAQWLSDDPTHDTVDAIRSLMFRTAIESSKISSGKNDSHRSPAQ